MRAAPGKDQIVRCSPENALASPRVPSRSMCVADDAVALIEN
jgi:hypothetical protein